MRADPAARPGFVFGWVLEVSQIAVHPLERHILVKRGLFAAVVQNQHQVRRIVRRAVGGLDLEDFVLLADSGIFLGFAAVLKFGGPLSLDADAVPRHAGIGHRDRVQSKYQKERGELRDDDRLRTDAAGINPDQAISPPLPFHRVEQPVGRAEIQHRNRCHALERGFRNGQVEIGKLLDLGREERRAFLFQFLLFARDLEHQEHHRHGQAQQHHAQQNFLVMFLEEIHFIWPASVSPRPA